MNTIAEVSDHLQRTRLLNLIHFDCDGLSVQFCDPSAIVDSPFDGSDPYAAIADGIDLTHIVVTMAHSAVLEMCRGDDIERYVLVTYGDGPEYVGQTHSTLTDVADSMLAQLQDEYPWSPANVYDLDDNRELEFALKVEWTTP